ncbi:MAG: hypothetical protein IJ054_06030 [Lachnospiraceae bacterium]|nr:hypothetical protein [Lachnospiraceae bacterium]
MICNICGADNPSGTSYCNDCGAKLIAPPVAEVTNSYQSEQQGVQAEQLQQSTNYIVQSGLNQQPKQQVVNSNSYQEQLRQRLQNDLSQGQPQVVQDMPQQMPKKKGRAAGVIVVILILLLIAGALLFFLPLLINGKLSGRYYSKDFDAYIMFDDGVYAVYGDYGGLEFGTYELDGEKIIFTDLNGSKDYGTFNKRKNTVEYGYTFKSDDKKAAFDKDIDVEYVNSLKFKLEDAAEAALEEEGAYNDARTWNSDYYISGDILETSDMEYIITFAECLGYGSDDVLSYLLKENYISFDLELNIERDIANVVFY